MYSTVSLQMPHSSLQVPSSRAFKLFAEILTSSNWFTSCLCHWYKPSCRTSCETLHRLGTVGAEFSLNTLTSTTAADSRQRLILVSVDSVLQNNTHFVQNATQNIVFVPSKKTSSNKLIIKTTTRPAPGAIHLRHRHGMKSVVFHPQTPSAAFVGGSGSNWSGHRFHKPVGMELHGPVQSRRQLRVFVENKVMPALRLFGRKWLAASDDLVFPCLFEIVFRIVWLGLISCVTSTYWSVTAECDEQAGLAVRIYLAGTLVLISVNMVLLVLLVNRSAQGCITEVQKRTLVAPLLVVKILLILPETGLNVFGTMWAFCGTIECKSEDKISQTVIEE
ncbi:neural stem cell-derived dendrite regulator [Culex quinquefasciatus]|uniref:Neural stem cell-derived dendrite regulator n=1 Tax=Culex quinquefasciatus TaxID=7176 RepID=B0WU81_CULQU|nr:neural stem cell-derived dendrite regulator [Culex quinquefasciatus]|eukprot:XP_001858090.1 neural stem cell-derived dendrite regulator [Culex quinquefasciatus]